MARARGASFAEFVATLSADDRELVDDLDRAVETTRKSSEAMQSNLDNVSVAASNAATPLADLGDVAAIAGASMGGAAARASGLFVALKSLGASLLNPITLLGALTVGVIAFREEVAKSLITFAEYLGLIENVGKQEDNAARSLERMTSIAQANEQNRAFIDAQETINRNLILSRAGVRAAETSDSEVERLAFGASIRSAQAALPPGLQTEANRSAVEEIVRNQRDASIATKRRQENDAAARVEQDRIQTETERIASDNESRVSKLTGLLQGLLVRTGEATASDFITDPFERRISELGELLTQPGSTVGGVGLGGTFGLRQVTPGNILESGQALGNPILTVAEETKQINKNQLAVAEQSRKLLLDLNIAAQNASATGTVLVLKK